ncbi:hypothetical protein P692DRAFT_20727542 [Suillus brevipes Sb2]|nr:hypothetical protein P692DRAFT_20727542 [Suillus brevipes Sb2]
MGGDHQCPVCQATFTRPQHVARHMRSHTGDRPYKCQYCGDQFARSDLLSRHVNKCHANEKPPQSATNGRRKGSASTSRATTSKQACDQCVQSSLPCDGCNPCSKCVQRKSRCTYVKFHRQTAPSGPGHHVPRPASVSSSLGSGRLSMDDFILGPPPVSVPSMDTSSGDPLYTTPFSFNHVYASSANALHLPMSLSSDSDMAGRTRVQADLLRHAGAPMLANPQGSPALVPELYTDHNQSPTHWLGWGESANPNPGMSVAQTSQPQFASLDEAFSQNQYGADGLDTLSSEMFTGSFIGLAYRPRRSSVDYSDGSSASHSIPSSATSSNAHLPLSAGDMYQGASEDFQQRMLLEPQRRRDSMTSPSAPESHDQQQSDQQSRVGEGGFSSAFGLMSIDDPNVLAGLSTDCVPFFSNAAMNMRPHSPNATPMPPKALSQQQLRDRGMSLSALPTPGLGRDADNLWKQYMRTPMSGPHPASSEAPGIMPQSPSSRRRVRVSSLPSSKTPTAERALPGMANGNGEGARMTLHGNPEDLRSYEAAVNARNASLNLNLPKRRGTRASPPASVPSGARGTNRRTDTTHSQSNANFDLNMSRPSSSSSASSLSQAFMSPHLPPMKGAAPPMNGVSISLPVPRVSSMGSSSTQSGSRDGSRESSVASDCTGSSEGEMFRPAFKRLPSQTLGPANAKRAQFEKNGVGEKGSVITNGLGVPNGGSRHIAALPGRACTSDKHASRNGLNMRRA